MCTVSLVHGPLQKKGGGARVKVIFSTKTAFSMKLVDDQKSTSRTSEERCKTSFIVNFLEKMTFAQSLSCVKTEPHMYNKFILHSCICSTKKSQVTLTYQVYIGGHRLGRYAAARRRAGHWQLHRQQSAQNTWKLLTQWTKHNANTVRARIADL